MGARSGPAGGTASGALKTVVLGGPGLAEPLGGLGSAVEVVAFADPRRGPHHDELPDQVDAVVLDADVPEISPADLCDQARRRWRRAWVVVFGGPESHALLLDVLRAGAHGFLGRDIGGDDLRIAWKAIRSGGIYVDPRVTGQLVNVAFDRDEFARRYELTYLDRALAALLADGLSNQQIATRLGRDLSTIKYHLRRLRAKLGAADRDALVASVRELGLG